MRVADTQVVDERVQLEIDVDLEGHGRWTGNIHLYFYSQEALRKERAKAAWTVESIRRIEKEGRMLPSPLPPTVGT